MTKTKLIKTLRSITNKNQLSQLIQKLDKEIKRRKK